MCKGMDKNNYRKGNNFSQVKRNKIQGSSNSSRALKKPLPDLYMDCLFSLLKRLIGPKVTVY